MKVRHKLIQYFCLRLCLAFLLLPLFSVAQEISEPYLIIRNSNLISDSVKEQKIDSLFQHYKNDSKFKQLVYDLYDYAKWQYGHGTIDKAIDVSKECVGFLDRLESFDEIKHKRAVNNLGFFYGAKKDYFNAYKTFKRLTTLGKMDESTAEAYRLTGWYLENLGDFYKAAEYFEVAIDVSRKIKDSKNFVINSVEASINYKEISTAQSFRRGVEILTDAIVLADSINSNTRSDKDKIPVRDMFMLYNHLGSLYNDRDDFNFTKSKTNYDKSLAIALQLKDSSLVSLVYNDLGYLYLHDVKKETIEYLDKALQFKTDTRLTATIYANKSLYFLKLENEENALENMQRSINVLSPVLIDNSKSLPSKEAVSICLFKYELLQNLIAKARIWLKFYDIKTNNKEYLEYAFETLKLADYLVDIIRFESSEQQSKLFWRKTASEIYTNAVKTCFYLNRAEEGFYFMEKNKALLLLEDLSLRQQKENIDVPDVIYERQLNLKTQILNYKMLLNSKIGKKDSIRLLLLKTKENYAGFLDSLKTDYTLYFKKQKPVEILTLNEVKKLSAENNEIYIEYILDNNKGFGMLITKELTKFFIIENISKLKDLSVKYRLLLERPLSDKRDLQAYNLISHSIFQCLFPKSILQDIVNKKLTIIPDSYLQNIPFEALNTTQDPHSFFIKQNEINYAYSISFLHQNKKWKRENKNNFLGFAPIIFSNDLSNLPLSKEELDYGVSLFSSNIFLYNEATKENFTKNIKDHAIIHIASHSDATDSKSPWIVFSDKKLTLDELYLTENTADLVVLSACKTSLGDINEGEGVMSLARGFFNTGANSVLSTLWNANDKSSTEIISGFYHGIKKGKTKSEALRTAKLSYLDRHQLSEQSPYYWSSFILIGDSEKISLENNALFIIIFLNVILLIISYLFYRKLKR